MDPIHKESVWGRARRDTKVLWEHWGFWMTQGFLGFLMTVDVIDIQHGAIIFFGLFIVLWIVTVGAAPVRQRDEARTALGFREQFRVNFTSTLKSNRAIQVHTLLRNDRRDHRMDFHMLLAIHTPEGPTHYMMLDEVSGLSLSLSPEQMSEGVLIFRQYAGDTGFPQGANLSMLVREMAEGVSIECPVPGSYPKENSLAKSGPTVFPDPIPGYPSDEGT